MAYCRLRVFLNISLLVSSLLICTAAYAQYDVNGNGTSDLILVQPQGDGSLNWIAEDPGDGAITELGVFGQAGWEPFVAPWLESGRFTRGIVRKSALEQVVLRISESSEE